MPVRVLDPSRTLVEKLVLLHTVHSDLDPALAVRAARHFYDVERLLSRPVVLERLAAPTYVLARDVCTYSAVAGRPAMPRPAAGFATSPAVQRRPTHSPRQRRVRRVIRQLLWPHVARPSFEDCVAAVHRHARLL